MTLLKLKVDDIVTTGNRKKGGGGGCDKRLFAFSNTVLNDLSLCIRSLNKIILINLNKTALLGKRHSNVRHLNIHKLIIYAFLNGLLPSVLNSPSYHSFR